MRHMLEHAAEAVGLAAGRTRPDLDTDRIFSLAMTRLLEIVGEAAAHVSVVARDQYPQIPWSEIAGLRNRLIHGYDAVDFDILWDTVENDLPALIANLQKAIGGIPPTR
jgi:uncharacterized protein with HEPN domain